MPLVGGTRLGPYTIGDAIGAGGMGEVYRARDTNLDRDVAIKVLPEAFAEDEERLARFEREAKVLASLNHPNIAAIHGFENRDGVRALVLEMVEGPTLAERITNGPIPLDETVTIARQIADALEAGHDAGIVHRDLKPANVKLKDDGTVKLLDYGLAKALEGETTGPGAGSDSELSQSPTLARQGTAVGVILGTASYMSPEQAKGKRVDRRTDIWAFGAVVFEMLTGRRAFEGEDVSEILAAVIRGEPDWTLFPGNARALTTLVKRCLTRDPRQRLQAIGEARIQLEKLASSPEPEKTPTEQPPRWLRALPWGLAAAFGLALWIRQPDEVEPPQTTRLKISLPVQRSLGGSATQGASVALSPDGRLLAYIAERPTRLYVRAMDQLTSTELPDTESARAPFFSPDGEWIGFFSDDDNELRKVRVTGGAPVTLCEARGFSRSGSWGEHGTILFRTSDGLFTVATNGEDCKRVSDEPVRWPQWLPREEAALVTTDDGIEVLDVRSGERTLVHQGGHYGRYVTSGHLVFVNEGNLYAAPFDLDSQSLTGPAALSEQDVQINPFGSAQFGVSAAGSLVYLTGPGFMARGRLAWFDREGNQSLLDAKPDVYVTPRVSPDGTRIAAVIPDANDETNLWVHDIARGATSRLTFLLDGVRFPVWSPDGRLLTYGAGLDDGTRAILMQRADEVEDPKRLRDELPDRASSFPHSWSPDGKRIAYTYVTQTSSNVGLAVLTVDGSEEPQVFHQTPFEEDMASFSRDGRFIAYESDESGRYEIYVRRYPGAGGRAQISTEGGNAPLFSPATNELFYVNAGSMIAVGYEVDGESFVAGRPVTLFDGDFLGSEVTGARDYDVSPDGKRFLMISPAEDTDEASGLVLVQHWFQELERIAPTGR